METLNGVRTMVLFGNKKVLTRKEHDTMNRVDGTLLRTEMFLYQLNRRQGLGITMFGFVLNRQQLRAMAIGLYAALSNVILYVLAVADDLEEADVHCQLAEPQRKALKAIVDSWGNGTCTFNETLEDIIS